MKTLVHTLGVIIPAILLALYINYVAELQEEHRAVAVAIEPESEVMKDPVTGLEIDPQTNMIMGKGYSVVKANCARCHPTTLITSYRGDKAVWLDAIRWMQAEKGLQTFSPETEEIILTYLSTYYGK